jgi:hypothetical protein
MTVTATKLDSSHESGKSFITWAWPAWTTIIYNNPVVAMIFAVSLEIIIQQAVGNEPCFLIKNTLSSCTCILFSANNITNGIIIIIGCSSKYLRMKSSCRLNQSIGRVESAAPVSRVISSIY